MTNADPSVVGSEVGDRNATQMGADCRADENLCTSCLIQANLTDFIEQGRSGELIFILNLLGSKSSNEDGCSVPDDLQYFSRWDFGDIDFKIGISIISCPSIESADDSDDVESCQVGHGSVVDCAQHVDLSPSDIGLVLIVDSIFIEPVIESGFEVDVISEVSGSCGGDKELCFIRDGVIVIEFLGGSLIVFTDKAEVVSNAYVDRFIPLVRLAACLILPKNNILLIKYGFEIIA